MLPGAHEREGCNWQMETIQFSRSVLSNSLQPRGLQHTRLPCPSPTSGACWNSCPLSRWCHPTISSSVVPFSCLQSFPASGSFPVSQFFTPGGWSIEALVSASVLPVNIEVWFPLGLTAVQGTLKNLLQHHSSNASILWHSAFFMGQLSHPYTTTGKTIALTRWTFVGEVMSLFFHMLSRFVTAFLPRSKCLLISWLQSPSAVILESKKIKTMRLFQTRSPCLTERLGILLGQVLHHCWSENSRLLVYNSECG